MGILLEADYKGVITGKVSPWSGLARAFSASKGGSGQNPLERREGEALEPQERDGQLTYELMNRDSGKLLLSEKGMRLTNWVPSNYLGPRSICPKCTLFRVHLRGSGSSHAT